MRRTKPNCAFCECGDHAFAALSRWGVTLVSTQDAGLLSAVWTLDWSPWAKWAYAYRKLDMQTRRLHVEILGSAEGLLIDHKNCNGLDNRRSNIRWATGSGNNANRRKSDGCLSKYKGVSFNRRHGFWHVRVKHKGQTFCFGSYKDEVVAAKVYDREAKKLFGEMARLNFDRSS